MRGEKPDRTPLMCQLAFGYLAANIAKDPLRFWYTPEGMSDALIEAAEKYHFDGILINKPTVTPGQLDQLVSLSEIGDGEKMAVWQDGRHTRILPDTDPVEMKQVHKDTRPELIDDFDVAAKPPCVLCHRKEESHD